MKHSIQKHNISNLSSLAPALRGLEDARTQRWTFCEPHFWARAQAMPNMSLGISQWKCPKWIAKASKRILPNHAGLNKARDMFTNSFRCYTIKFFGACMAREMPKISLGYHFLKSKQIKTTKKQTRNLTPRTKKQARNRTLRVWKTRENAWFSQHVWKKRWRTHCVWDGTET